MNRSTAGPWSAPHHVHPRPGIPFWRARAGLLAHHLGAWDEHEDSLPLEHAWVDLERYYELLEGALFNEVHLTEAEALFLVDAVRGSCFAMVNYRWLPTGVEHDVILCDAYEERGLTSEDANALVAKLKALPDVAVLALLDAAERVGECPEEMRLDERVRMVGLVRS